MNAQNLGTKATAISANRYRMNFTFWLDAYKDDESSLADQLEELKSKRKFTATIRAALALYFDLKAGRTDELYRMFPGLKIAHSASSAPTLPASISPTAESTVALQGKMNLRQNLILRLLKARPARIVIPHGI